MSHYVQSETKRKPGRPSKPGTHAKVGGFGKYRIPTELEKFEAVKPTEKAHTPTRWEMELYYTDIVARGDFVPTFSIPASLARYLH